MDTPDMHAKDKVLRDLANIEAQMKDELGRPATDPELLTRLTMFFSVCVGIIAHRSGDPQHIVSRAATQAEFGALETINELQR